MSKSDGKFFQETIPERQQFGLCLRLQLAVMGAEFVFVGVLTYYMKQSAHCGGRHHPVPV